MSETRIHPTAIISEGAELDVGVEVGPFCFIGPNVRIGKETKLHSHAVVTGWTTLGEENEIFPFASVGHAPQDKKYKGEKTTLVIGNANRIRECATLQPGTVQGGGVTTIGNGNLFMAYSHVGHDCIIGNDNVIANSCALAGHVTIHNRAILSGLSAVHQFCTIGDMAMAGGGAMVNHDLPPFCIGEGNRAKLRGLNVVGMRRAGHSSDEILAAQRAYRILFHMGFPTVAEAVACVAQENLLDIPCVAKLVSFVEASKRGVVRPHATEEAE